jgi:hypothetical protein
MRASEVRRKAEWANVDASFSKCSGVINEKMKCAGYCLHLLMFGAGLSLELTITDGTN